MSLLVDTVSLIQPTVTSLEGLKLVSSVNKQMSASSELLVENTASVSDWLGSSSISTLSLVSASESIIQSSSTGLGSSKSDDSGSLEANVGNVNRSKMTLLMSGFLVVSFLVGTL